MPEFDDKGNVVTIKHGDGSVTISLDGKPIKDADRKKPTGWFSNLAEDIGPDEVGRISDDLLRGVESDDRSRQGMA